ncbi:MAG: Cys-rich peptide radical SAM maturase CcpM [Defluviitaleaceae bacterium]|nr:Cys-rich peptide radical SAM maturase CcpM [Defluviitaleaceae bacterium]
MAVIIKTFSTPGGKYVYDRETHSLLAVSNEEFDACQRVESNTANNDDWKLLQRYRDQGYLKESCLNEIIHPDTKYMPFYLQSGMSSIVMQVTQNCNLRCSYCAYGGGYGTQRTHSNKTMSLELMKKCVDFVMARSRDVNLISIGFYGGEPLMEIGKIKDCVAYIKDSYRGREVIYTLTTNGTFFSDDTISFLAENNFNTLISFDGPREWQDKNRVYPDGRGTFDDILKNVKRIKDCYPQYYNNISFTTVVAPGTDFSCVNEFYSSDDIVAGNLANFNTVRESGADKSIVYDDFYHATHNYQTMKHLLAAIGLYDSAKTSKLFERDMGMIARLYSKLSKSEIQEKAHPGGPCLPGSMRPFVDVDGRIFPCERVMEGTEAMQIGHIDTGFIMEKIDAMLNVGKLTEAECMACWNFIECGLCVAACDDNGQLSGKERLKYCNGVKNNFIYSLFTICLLLENEYDFEKYSKEYLRNL